MNSKPDWNYSNSELDDIMNHVTFRNTKASATCENTKLTGTEMEERIEYKVEEKQHEKR